VKLKHLLLNSSKINIWNYESGERGLYKLVF
jgi:hypothetical protein